MNFDDYEALLWDAEFYQVPLFFLFVCLDSFQ